jgi:hypothetical protein
MATVHYAPAVTVAIMLSTSDTSSARMHCCVTVNLAAVFDALRSTLQGTTQRWVGWPPSQLVLLLHPIASQLSSEQP